MKTALNFFIFAFLMSSSAVCYAQISQTNTAPASAQTGYTVSSRAADSDVLTETVQKSAPNGKTITQVNHVTRIASGLNYWNGTAWTPSDSTFQISDDNQFVYANNVQTKVRLSADLATSNSVTITTPDGIVLGTTPVAIGLYDSVGGSSLILASITNCTGTLVGSNVVVYENAFNGISGNIVYTLQRGSFSQDIVWKQNIDPTDYNFPTNSTEIQIFSAFNSPEPQQIARPLYVETNQEIRAQMASPDFIDHTLKFGQLKFAPGRAFSTTATNRFSGAPIAKSFESISGQSYLIESVRFSDIRNQLEALPRVASSRIKNRSRDRREAAAKQSPDREGAGTHHSFAFALKNLVIPRPHPATKATFAIKSRKSLIAEVMGPKGVVADYITLPDTEPDPMFFAGDTTYFVDGEADFNDVIFEGGTVLKYPNATNAYVEVDGSVTCQTSDWLPAFFVAADDDSVGQSGSWFWPGYTGIVQPGGYAYRALDIEGSWYQPAALSNLRISDAQTGIYSANDLAVTNLQVINCGNAFYIYSEDGSTFENVLVANVNCAFGGYFTVEATAENTTVVNCSLLLGDDSEIGASLYFFNSILANVTNAVVYGGDEMSGNNNGLYNCSLGSAPFNFSATTTNVWPFQTVGGADYYLTTNCVFHGAGTTNTIDPALLPDLARRTTCPPIVYDAINISFLGTLGPQAQRDTNSSPDLGWHYAPLDYAFGGCDLYSNLTFTTGTTVGWFEDNGTHSGEPYSICLDGNANLSFEGNATQPGICARYAMVQEAANGNWTGNGWMGGIEFNGGSPIPQLSANFTKFPSDNWNANLFRDNWDSGNGNFRNCEFYNFAIGSLDMTSLGFTNCLFFRYCQSFWGSPNLAYENCTFFNGSMDLYRSSPVTWLFENCSFDGTAFQGSDSYDVTNYTTINYNAYNTNNTNWVGYPLYPPYSGTLENVGSNDVMVTSYNWESSWFGDFYLPSDSLLITNGSTNANLLGLYHFTTTTNLVDGLEVPDGTNIVTIGYHYVATDQYGNPIDSNGDGIPDYLEDPSGLGVLGPQITLISPNTGAFYTEPATVPIQATVNDWSGLVTNVDFTESNSVQGRVSIIGFPGGPYTYSWPIVPAGQYGLTGFAKDNTGLSATSAVISVTVTNLCGY